MYEAPVAVQAKTREVAARDRHAVVADVVARAVHDVWAGLRAPGRQCDPSLYSIDEVIEGSDFTDCRAP